MKTLVTILIILLFFFPARALALTPTPTLTLSNGPVKVVVRVDGLSCPFCAYGLEKKIKRMEGVEDFTIDIVGGKVEVLFIDKKFYQKEKLEEVVRDSGFTPRKIEAKDTD